MKKISVVIPVYNLEDYIGECIKSLLNQTYVNLEIICVNDGSTDNSLDIINTYAKSDNRIKIISQINQGSSVARNRGIDEAEGDYIHFMDGDDFISEDYMTEMFNAISKKKYKVAHNPKFLIYFSENNVKNNIYNMHYPGAFKDNAITHSPWKLYERAFLLKIGLRFYEGVKHQDYEFWNKFIAHIDESEMVFCEKGLYFYRQHSNSITTKTTTRNTSYNKDILLCIASIHKYYQKNRKLLVFKPLYLNMLDSHLLSQSKWNRLRFILEARRVLKKFDDDFIKLINPNCIPVYEKYTSSKVLSLMYQSYFKKLE